ncbi:putative AC9 transposase, partial [Orchesella cincta]
MKHQKKKPLRKFLDTLTAKERHQIDLQVGKMIYGCNLPFAIVENHEFKELLRKLRPAYFPPNRKLIGNEILEEVYMEVKERLTEVIAKKEVTLVQDGWEQTKLSHAGSATKDADYCLGVLSAAIEECQNVHKCQVIGFVTDNCNSSRHIRFGCNAHYLNLVGQKVIPHDKIDNIVKIQKYFKNHHFQSAALSAAKGKRPVLPGLTRWNSQIDCIENYIENHAIYLDLARKNPRKFDSSITQMINDFSLYTAAEKLKSLAKPIAVALDSKILVLTHEIYETLGTIKFSQFIGRCIGMD